MLLRVTDTTLRASDDMSCPQMLETRSDALDNSMTAFDYLRPDGDLPAIFRTS